MVADDSRTTCNAETVSISPETARDMANGAARKVVECLHEDRPHMAEEIAYLVTHLEEAADTGSDDAKVSVNAAVLDDARVFAVDDTPLEAKAEVAEVLSDK